MSYLNASDKELNEDDAYPGIFQLAPSCRCIEDKRVTSLRSHFIKEFHVEPVFYVRVPGRVNLIGEHVDYCGYSVCPMAIQQDILIAGRSCDDQMLHLTNTEEKYPNFECQMNSITISKTGTPSWHSYVMCGVLGVLDTLADGRPLSGMKAAVTGNIPPNSGLSSSSALVSAAALVTAYVHKLKFTKQEIATLAAKSERFIGTEGGGMDQAIAFLARKGCAKHIMFNPLRSEDVNLPKDAVFVIAHSLAEKNKAASSDFNCRVVECRLASQILAKKSDLAWEKLIRLADLQKELDVDLDAMVRLVTTTLHDEPYSKQEITSILGVSEEELNQLTLSANTTHIQSFLLKQRALHVYQEASRVERFCRECRQSKGNSDSESSLRSLGELMKKSHSSLQQLYECSHPNLDRIVALAAEHTYGARLTGAGWGGCTVALTTPTNAGKYIQALKDEYYAKSPDLAGRNVDKLVFATEPNAGAAIFLF